MHCLWIVDKGLQQRRKLRRGLDQVGKFVDHQDATPVTTRPLSDKRAKQGAPVRVDGLTKAGDDRFEIVSKGRTL